MMSEFWYTATTMKKIKGEDYQAFKMFSPVYFFWWIIYAVLVVLVKSIFPKLSDEKRHKVYVWLTVILFIDEIAKYVMTLLTGQFEWQLLPLHLCSINLFVCLWHTIHPNDTAKEILYSVCLPAALVALISPSWMSLPLWNFMHIHSASIHVLLGIYPIMILAEGYQPKIKNIYRVIIFLVLACAVAYGANLLLGTNFFFLMHDANNPILKIISGLLKQYYIMGVMGLGVIIALVMYVPTLLHKRTA